MKEYKGYEGGTSKMPTTTIPPIDDDELSIGNTKGFNDEYFLNTEGETGFYPEGETGDEIVFLNPTDGILSNKQTEKLLLEWNLPSSKQSMKEMTKNVDSKIEFIKKSQKEASDKIIEGYQKQIDEIKASQKSVNDEIKAKYQRQIKEELNRDI